jgi:hypothetical protein
VAKCVRRMESKEERRVGTEVRRESTCETVDFLISFCCCRCIRLID